VQDKGGAPDDVSFNLSTSSTGVSWCSEKQVRELLSIIDL